VVALPQSLVHPAYAREDDASGRSGGAAAHARGNYQGPTLIKGWTDESDPVKVSPSGYYRLLKAPVVVRNLRRLAVEEAVVRIDAKSRRIYGATTFAHKLPA
jgi:hypothetical protein